MIEMREILSLSALIVAVLLVRAMFKNRVPKRMIYCLWLVVLLKLCLPGTLVSLPVLPAEDAAAPAQSAEQPVQTTPVIQRPAQTVTKPQTPAQQPVSPVQETAKPAAKPLATAQILQIVWFSGSALLGLWLFGTWLTFTIRLRKSRKFLGRQGRTNIYVSKHIKSPCLAGLIPAVYLTEDVLRNDTTELIVRHELTHLHHLDFLWSLCRTIAVIVYWWNPLIWLAAICSKRDAELACDEAVAARLPESKRLAYARAILAQAPRKASALSLAGPPVKERILFLTKKQRTSVLCVVLALLLVVSATGCSFAELTRREAEQAAPAEEETQPKTEPQDEAAPEPVAEITQPERTSPEEELPVDETARAAWLDFADRWRLDYLPVFSRGAVPASTSEYLMWVFTRNMDALKEQGYMTKSYVETEIQSHFEVGNLTHEGLTKTWNFDGETYTAVPGGVKDRPLARLDGITTSEENGRRIYYVQYTLVQPDHLVLSEQERQALAEQIARGDSADLQELSSYTVCFAYENGGPVFLSHTERSSIDLEYDDIKTWSWAPYETLYRTDGVRMGLVREADGTRHIGEVPDTKVWIRLKDGTLLSDEPFDACIDYMGEPEGEVYCIRNGTGYRYTVSTGDGSFRLSEVDEPKTLAEDHFGYRLRVTRWDSREPCYGIVTADGTEVIAPVYERVEIPFPDRFLLYEGGASQGPVMGRCRLTDETGNTLCVRFHWIDYSVFDDGYIGIAVCYGERAAYPCYDEDGQPMPEGYWLVDRDGKLCSERFVKLSFGAGEETHAISEDDVLRTLREDGTEVLLPVAELLLS
mgnify:FL=1